MGELVLFINTNRDGYSPEQIGDTMTVGELKELLNDFNDNTKVMFKNDGGYTYGAISTFDFEDEYIEAEDDEDDEDWEADDEDEEEEEEEEQGGKTHDRQRI